MTQHAASRAVTKSTHDIGDKQRQNSAKLYVCVVRVQNLVSQLEGVTQSEDVWERGAGGRIYS
jgi:hypothetical protein